MAKVTIKYNELYNNYPAIHREIISLCDYVTDELYAKYNSPNGKYRNTAKFQEELRAAQKRTLEEILKCEVNINDKRVTIIADEEQLTFLNMSLTRN